METLNRNAILIHLRDIRAIECGLYELENQIRICDNYIRTAAIPRNFQVPVNSKENSALGGAMGWIASGLICAAIGWFIDDLISIVNHSTIFTTIGCIIGIIIAIVGLITTLSANAEARAVYEREYSNYLRDIENDRKRVENERFEKSRMTRQRNELYTEYQQLSYLRDRAYSANIIPLDFRNIYCIYKICNFMETSTGTLSEALMNCNLRIIQEQLSRIIEQNKTIILNQYIQQAQNRELLASNKQMLSQLRNIEANTETAAQYAQIAASNSEVCSYMLTATYLQNMIR